MGNSYPYNIQPDVQFNLESIPVFGIENRIEFFYQYKRNTENLYIGKIKKDNLFLKHSISLLSSIESYFSKQQYTDDNIVEDFSKRLFPKVCWLTNSALTRGFKYPVCVHYNPRIQANVIHPGSIRNHVIALFQEIDLVDCIYFNTGGVEFDFMKSLDILTKEKLLTYKDTMHIDLVGDHASIIPHINLDPGSVRPNIKVWQEFIKLRLNSPTFTIKCNQPIGLLEPWCVNSDACIEITIHKMDRNNYEDVVCKCAILSVLGKSYECVDFTIKHNIKFNTPL